MRLHLPAVLVAAAVLVAPAASADWPSFHGDSKNSGWSQGSEFEVYTEIWWSSKASGNSQVKASPVVKDGILIATDVSGLVRALDTESGYELWRQKFPSAIEGTPAIAGDDVFVVDIAGNLKSLNLRDGSIVHQVSVGRTYGSILEHENKIFIGTEAGELKAYYASNLAVLWTFRAADVKTTTTTPANGPVQCSNPISGASIIGKPAVYDGKVFFGGLNNYLIAVSESGVDGKTKVQWIYQAGDIIVGAPTVVSTTNGPRIVVGSYDGKVYAFNPSPSGAGTDPCFGLKPAPTWTFTVPAGPNAQPSKVDSSPASDGQRIYFGANNGRVYALNAGTGAHAWNTSAGSFNEPVLSSPAVANGIVVVGSENKRIYWLDAADGSELKGFNAQSAVRSSPAIDGALAFIAAVDGTWYAFGDEKPKRPDLQVSAITGTRTTITATVKNAGEAASNATQVRVLSKGALLFDADVASLQPGATLDITRNATFETGKTPVRAIADPDNGVRESDESNNARDSNITIAAPVQPPTPGAETSTGKGKIPAWDLAVPIALVGVALLVRRRIR